MRVNESAASRRALRRRGRSMFFAAVACLAWVLPAGAQEAAPRLRAIVERVVGTNVYLDVGTGTGLSKGDTIAVARDSAGALVDALAVIESTRTRSLVTFTGEAVSAAEGLTLFLESGRVAVEGAGEVPTGQAETARELPDPAFAPLPDPSSNPLPNVLFNTLPEPPFNPLPDLTSKVLPDATSDAAESSEVSQSAGPEVARRIGVEVDIDLSRRLRAIVEQVAGTTIYLDVGTEAGLSRGDTIRVARDSVGALVGAFAVIQSTRVRSVVTFADEMFSVTRGLALYLESDGIAVALGGGVPTDQARAADALPEPTTYSQQSSGLAQSQGPVVTGRIGLDMDMVRSQTTYGSGEGQRVDRTLATPAMRLYTTVSQIPGGLTFRLNGRMSYRHSSQSVSTPSSSVRLYNASLEKTFEGAPLQIEAGRFYNRYDNYSGYWDGLMARVGGSSGGVGVVAGFEPDRFNQTFSTELPKLTLFGDYSVRSRSSSYRVAASAHRVEPKNDFLSHTFVGVSQRLRVGKVRFSQDVQVDRNPIAGGWEVTRFQLNAGVDVAQELSFHAGISRHQPYRLHDTVSVFSYARDRANVGLSLYAGGMTLGADVAVNRDLSDEIGTSYSGFVSSPRIGRFTVNANASYWQGTGYEAISLAPGLSAGVGRAVLNAGYRFYYSDYDGRSFTNHAVEGGASIPVGRGMRYRLQATTQWGGDVFSNRLYTGFSKSFR